MPRSVDSPGRSLGLACAAVALLATAGCTGPTGDTEVAPAGVPTGAPPMAPVEAQPTYADGEDPASSAGPGAGDAPPTDVVVTYADWNGSERSVDVGGYVQGAIESDGRCTVRLSRAAVVVTGSAEARPDASTTACSMVRVQVPEDASGTWSGVLQFTAGSVTAESATFEVTVR